MDTRRFGAITVTLPNLDSFGATLTDVPHLGTTHDAIEAFRYADERLRDLDLTATRLVGGRLEGVRADRVRLDEARLHAVEFTNCTFDALRCARGKFSRVLFRDCTLIGAAFEECTFDNVLFEGCRLDYATVAGARATGPLVFTGSSLSEAELTGNEFAGETAVHHCTLHRTAFRSGNYRGTDLRGSGLDALVGGANLTGAVVSSGQEPQLARAVLADLGLSVSGEEV
ncbi:pentapeptide repeat-containing protein [Streptomyces sp. NRRL F-5123]|uniref:pentapeptide repeat-containing protein n=1 Tax=Streptomyces sp. NRRL F-5123 TaxID=1463856 RepID=UPI0004E1AB04|nr:pentapeptide repeat-containing protein [Streptomyces sp. NRRL F-5123]